ncbi:SRPBCC family protein [Pseudonocardia humida]|uniref:Activator of Hsp90 ATPase-like protein n=1 Tax=Pseudonocardia humida TaxID=2800819 RepID=A0ABT1AC49_9PSEU|nr:hypothetical protein [Pseudonocardia humida]MCO1660627.1 hypothetical protein [Pseudonocardia humida]
MTDDFEMHLVLPAPPETVWAHLREPELLGRWFGWHHDGFDAELREVFVDAVVVERPGRELVIAGGHRFTVDGHPAGSTLHVSRVSPADGSAWDPSWRPIEEGWVTFLQQLRLVLDLDPAAAAGTRHTVMRSGSPRAGLVTDAGPGSAWSARLFGPEELAGTVWFRTPHQLGLRVHGWGDGLLTIMTDVPGGEGRVVLTTYGRSDDAAAATERDLLRWWAGVTDTVPAS